MKKIKYLLILMFSLFTLVACTDGLGSNKNTIDDVVFESVKVDFDGESHSIFVQNLPQGIVVVYEGNDVVVPGTHTVIAKLYDAENKFLKELSATITILNKEVPEELKSVVFEDISVEFDGKKYSIEVQNLPEGYLVAYEGNNVSEVGTHTVTATIRNSKYEVVYVFTATIKISGKTTVELPLV